MVFITLDTSDLDLESVRPKPSQRLMLSTLPPIVLDTALLLTPTTDMASPLPMAMVSVTLDTPDLDMESVKLRLTSYRAGYTSPIAYSNFGYNYPTTYGYGLRNFGYSRFGYHGYAILPIMAAIPNDQAQC